MTALGQTAAHAASFEVTNLDDAGAGSLRDAIAAANGAVGPDAITFAAGLTGTITLSSGQLTISDSLQIVGPGRGVLNVDGGGASRVFDIPLSPGDVTVAISGLTISNGNAPTGGGIRLQDESLSLDDVALVGNTATGNGGGLYADGFAMTLTVRNSTISGNAARGGAGAYIEDTKGATVFDTVVIDGNVATEKGGGIFFYDPDADVVINNATITDNAARKGGGVYLYSQDNGSFTISNSTVSGNAATTGGGVYLYDIDHPVAISNSTISGNTATNGGGINIDRISAPAVISNSTISGNTATGAAGGIRLARGGGLTIAHSTITANSAANAGGARFPGPVSMSHVVIAGNSAATTADLHAAGGVTADFSVIGTMIGAVTDGGGNQFGVTDPLLGPLTNNGGSTLTHLPLPNSPAVDTGNPAASASATDQRGMPRVAGIIDVGAVETQGGTIQFDATSATVAENAGTLTVAVTRTGAGDLPATVEVTTADGTAIAPGDYSAVTTQLSWAAGETGTKTITIPVVLDAALELDEAFSVALAKPTGATLGTRTSLAVTLQDSNTAPTIAAISDVSTRLGKSLPPIGADVGDAEQPASALTVTATSSNQAVVANAAIAISGADARRVLKITPRAAGVTTITVTVSDGSLSSSETFTVTVTAPPATTTTTTPPTTTTIVIAPPTTTTPPPTTKPHPTTTTTPPTTTTKPHPTTTTTTPATTTVPATTTAPSTTTTAPATTTTAPATTTTVPAPTGPPACSGVTLATEKILGGGLTTPVAVSLPDGVYSITLTSYDPTHAAGVQIEQTTERWVLEAYAGQQLVYTSPAIADLADSEQSLVQAVDQGVALEGVTSLRARHIGGGLNSIMPVCALFQRTGDVHRPEPLEHPEQPDNDHRPSDQSVSCPDGTKPDAETGDHEHDSDDSDPGDTP